MENAIKILISSLFQDAGESTRALEIAKGLRENCPEGLRADIRFLSHGGRFEKLFRKEGFSVVRVAPEMNNDDFWAELKTKKFQMIGDEKLAEKVLRGEIEAIRAFKPDVLLHGFWPTAGIAAKLTKVSIEIAYLPLPFAPGPFSTFLLKDLPDFVPVLSRLPAEARRKIMASVPKSLKRKAPWLRQGVLLHVCRQYGDVGIRGLFDMIKADFTVVNDLPDFYEGDPVPDNFAVTGPLFSPSASDAAVNPEILRHFASGTGKVRIFCTLGSSGSRENLREALKALCLLPGETYQAVVLCPPSVCPLQEAATLVQGHSEIFVTDEFVPAAKVNAMADLVISHGGQGTVQTAIYSGTPLIGFAVQPEQQINLEHVTLRGAGLRIPLWRWKSIQIAHAVEMMIKNYSSYSGEMKKLSVALRRSDGKGDSARAIWSYISKRG